jgi:23S rRNA-/tRNA-specific pseudouridylate synthase
VASADCSAAACLVRAEAASPALLAVEPVTGRKHQIRVHARLAGCPLLGDRAYGGPTRLLGRDGSVRRLERIALHAARVELHAARGIWRVQAPLPEELVDLWRQLGGRVEDFELGLQGVRL